MEGPGWGARVNRPAMEDVMRRDKLFKAVMVAALVVFSASYAYATDEFVARLNGFQEIGALVGPTGAIRSNGSGTMQLQLDKNAGTATFTLTFPDVGATLPLTGTVTQAHIHFGKRHVAGGVLVFFCSNLGNGPAGTQACPNLGAATATVTGTFTNASVVAIPTQNVTAGEFDALVDALRSNTAYANIHTSAFPAGE